MYFRTMGNIEYGDKTAVDISKRVSFIDKLTNNDDFWFKYTLSDGELPEHVASDFYNKSEYHWVILLINDIIDPFYDWLLTYPELKAFTENKYGENELNATHHWELDDIKYTSDPGLNAVIVTNIEYEDIINEAKREIKVVYFEYVDDIVKEFKEIVS